MVKKSRDGALAARVIEPLEEIAFVDHYGQPLLDEPSVSAATTP